MPADDLEPDDHPIGVVVRRHERPDLACPIDPGIADRHVDRRAVTVELDRERLGREARNTERDRTAAPRQDDPLRYPRHPHPRPDGRSRDVRPWVPSTRASRRVACATPRRPPVPGGQRRAKMSRAGRRRPPVNYLCDESRNLRPRCGRTGNGQRFPLSDFDVAPGGNDVPCRCYKLRAGHPPPAESRPASSTGHGYRFDSVSAHPRSPQRIHRRAECLTDPAVLRGRSATLRNTPRRCSRPPARW